MVFWDVWAQMGSADLPFGAITLLKFLWFIYDIPIEKNRRRTSIVAYYNMYDVAYNNRTVYAVLSTSITLMEHATASLHEEEAVVVSGKAFVETTCKFDEVAWHLWAWKPVLQQKRHVNAYHTRISLTIANINLLIIKFHICHVL